MYVVPHVVMKRIEEHLASGKDLREAVIAAGNRYTEEEYRQQKRLDREREKDECLERQDGVIDDLSEL
jgi:hypothetical protein